MLELFLIPDVTPAQEVRYEQLASYTLWEWKARSNERVWLLFLIQANRFEYLANWDYERFVKINYMNQALLNYEAYLQRTGDTK